MVVITPNPTRELGWTVDLFDELIRARMNIFREYPYIDGRINISEYCSLQNITEIKHIKKRDSEIYYRPVDFVPFLKGDSEVGLSAYYKVELF